MSFVLEKPVADEFGSQIVFVDKNKAITKIAGIEYTAMLEMQEYLSKLIYRLK